MKKKKPNTRHGMWCVTFAKASDLTGHIVDCTVTANNGEAAITKARRMLKPRWRGMVVTDVSLIGQESI